MGDRANINASYGGRQSGLDGEAIMASFGGGQPGIPTPPPGPVTTFPTTGSVVYDLDPDALTAANNSRVSSITDPNGITVSSPGTGPRLIYNVAGGRKALRFAGTGGEHLNMTPPASVKNAMASRGTYSVVMVLKNLTTPGDFQYIMNDSGNSTQFVAASDRMGGAGAVVRSIRSVDGPNNVHTLIYTGDTNIDGSTGRTFMDGVQFGQGLTSATLPANGTITIGSDDVNGTRPFYADILSIRIISTPTPWTNAEALQAHLWACQRFGKTSPLAGLTHFKVFAGDSITFGIGAFPSENYPTRIAETRGIVDGSYAVSGHPSGQVIGAGQLAERAPRDVDDYRRVVNMPLLVMFGEWYNQGVGGGTTAQGVAIADNNRNYAAARKVANPDTIMACWTSTSSTQRDGAARDGFNQSLVNNPGAYSFVVPVHTNAQIGVDGASASGNFTDGIHPNGNGYIILGGLINSGLTSAGY